MLTYVGRQARWAAVPSGRRGGSALGSVHGSTRSDGRAPDTGPGDAATISRLQSTAGNRAVAQLLTAQRDDEKPPGPTTAPKAADAKGADPKAAKAAADKAALRKAWADAGVVAGGPLFDLINSDLGVDKLVDMALPELVGLANEGAAAGFAKGTEASKGEVKPIGLDTKEAGQVTGALTGWAQKGAEDWLKSADGKQFLAKAQKYVNEQPKGPTRSWSRPSSWGSRGQ